MSYAILRENALKHLETTALADMARHEVRTKFKIQPKYTYNGALTFKACEYKVFDNNEARWFWWDVMEVELESTKTYNNYDHEDNDWWLKEALGKAKRARASTRKTRRRKMTRIKRWKHVSTINMEPK
jgi:hypothetical protein